MFSGDVERYQRRKMGLLNEWFDDILWKIKQGSQGKTKLNSSVIVLSKNKQSWFTFDFFHHDWKVSTLTDILDNLEQYSS